MSNNYQILIEKLDAFIRKYYKNRLLKGAIYVVGLLLASFIVFTSVEYFGITTLGGTAITAPDNTVFYSIHQQRPPLYVVKKVVSNIFVAIKYLMLNNGCSIELNYQSD